MKPTQRFVYVALLVAVLSLAVAGVCGCEGEEGSTPIDSRPAPGSTGDRPALVGADKGPADDTAGSIKVVWTSRAGSARQDPMGLLSDTPLVKDGSGIHAQRTVKFTPNAPNAKSAEGQYVYTLDLKAEPGSSSTFKGTMTIDWTMTIVKANSKSEFHAVYKSDATATYNEADKTVTGGVAKGTASISDTFWSGDTKLKPTTSSDAFEWGFATP